jgi:hypothetical protein
MELVRSHEQNYQLELYAYRTTFLDFKYEPPSFVFVELEPVVEFQQHHLGTTCYQTK